MNFRDRYDTISMRSQKDTGNVFCNMVPVMRADRERRGSYDQRIPGNQTTVSGCGCGQISLHTSGRIHSCCAVSVVFRSNSDCKVLNYGFKNGAARIAVPPTNTTQPASPPATRRLFPKTRWFRAMPWRSTLKPWTNPWQRISRK